MHAFDVLGDLVRRRILVLLADGERAAGDVSAVVQQEFGITQPAVSQHLKVLRENGFARVRAEGTRRLYAVDAAPLKEVDAWLEHFRQFWRPHLDALATELARGKRERRRREKDADPSNRHEGRGSAMTDTFDPIADTRRGLRDHGGDANSNVRLRLTPEDGMTVFALEHSPVPVDMVPNASPELWGLGAGWEMGMNALGDYLAGSLPDGKASDWIASATPEELMAAGERATQISDAWAAVIAAQR